MEKDGKIKKTLKLWEDRSFVRSKGQAITGGKAAIAAPRCPLDHPLVDQVTAGSCAHVCTMLVSQLFATISINFRAWVGLSWFEVLSFFDIEHQYGGQSERCDTTFKPDPGIEWPEPCVTMILTPHLVSEANQDHAV